MALKQYRCNGRVQYRPCEVDPAWEKNRADFRRSAGKRARWAPLNEDSSTSPRIFEDSYERASESEGLWRGRVAGNGLVHLNLYIYKRGRLHIKRYMGSVALKNEDTFFAFKSPLPDGDDWTWVIKADS